MGKIKFIRIDDKFVNMDEVESIEYIQSKVPISFQFDMEDEYRIKITYKSGHVNTIYLKDKEKGIALMEDIYTNIKRWNTDYGE